MNSTNEQLKYEVMQKVNKIYTWRMFVRPCIIEGTVLSCLVMGSTFLVSVPHVLNNLSTNHSPISFVDYIFDSFLRTEFSVKILTLAILVLFLLIIRNAYTFFGVRRFIPFVHRKYSVQ